jgi:hypothetical protein
MGEQRICERKFATSPMAGLRDFRCNPLRAQGWRQNRTRDFAASILIQDCPKQGRLGE